MPRLFGWMLLAGYVAYGAYRFRGLFMSARYVRRPPPSGLWGPGRFWSAETWTAEGLVLRNRLFVWQGGLAALLLMLAYFW